MTEQPPGPEKLGRAIPWPSSKSVDNGKSIATAATKQGDAATVSETNPALEEAISIRAREIWFQNGGQDGSTLADWLDAEKEILDERKVMTKCSRCGAETILYSGIPICVDCDKSSGAAVDRRTGEESKKPPTTAQSIQALDGGVNLSVLGSA